jgi:hypothetical protein
MENPRGYWLFSPANSGAEKVRSGVNGGEKGTEIQRSPAASPTLWFSPLRWRGIGPPAPPIRLEKPTFWGSLAPNPPVVVPGAPC